MFAVEVPILGVASQGRSRREAFEMIADAIESLVNRDGFRVTVHPGPGDCFEVGADDHRLLSGLLLRRARSRSGLTLSEVAERLGSTSVNAYARYEQGRSIPTLRKLTELFSALRPGGDYVIEECRADI
jgi:predicted transcriptional regulator